MYDNTCKFLAETFPTDFASWILGEPISLTELEPSELSIEPIRADSLIFLTSANIILHIEFQTRVDENMAFRMLDYWVRLRRKFPGKKIHQTIIYLKPTNSPLASQNIYTSDKTKHEFQIIKIWEQSPQVLQQYQGLIPFVALCQTDNPEEVLRQAVQQIEVIADREIQANLLAATYVISGLALDQEIIHTLLRQEIMKESVTYQEILREGMAEGKAEGKAEGMAEGELLGKLKSVPGFLALGLSVEQIAGALGLDIELVRGVVVEHGEVQVVNRIALNMLRSGMAIDLIAQVTELSPEQIQKLL
jgi:predicted transposase/invertase (TIGR01784 family)